jgi:hypothetical protein
LDVAGWHLFRQYYLRPSNSWYRSADGDGFVESPDAHYEWVRDWHTYPRLVHAAPRGTCKTTINLEDILRLTITQPYWECALFLATQNFVTDRLGRCMDQVEHNPRIIEDFGKMKPSRGSGLWNRGSTMELVNGSRIMGIPIKGASLGTRPSGLVCLDDVEKSDEQVKFPTDLRENAQNFFFNALLPMARAPGRTIPMRIIGTLYNRRMFIWQLYQGVDSRIRDFFKRTLMTVPDMNWDAMDEEWQAREKQQLGPAAYAAQCLNAPGTDAERILQIHPELCTYWLEDQDQWARTAPLQSQAKVVTHVLSGWKKDEISKEDVPVPRKLERTWGEVVGKMTRFITVDSAKTTTSLSDFSAIHVMGFENVKEHRDTLYSLDCWVGKCSYEELVERVYKMCMAWGVRWVGIEAYPVQSTFFEMARDLLPAKFGPNVAVPRIIPIKPPSNLDKADKIMQIAWRFNQFRVKVPVDCQTAGYRALVHQIENFTEDMALLENDDAIDTLAMHYYIGKPHKAIAASVVEGIDLVQKLRDGEIEEFGVPLLSGLNASDIPREVFQEWEDRQYEEAGIPTDYLDDLSDFIDHRASC